MIVTASPVLNATGGVIIKRVRIRRSRATRKRTRSGSGDTRRAGEAGAEAGAEGLTRTTEKRIPIVLGVIIATPFQRWNI